MLQGGRGVHIIVTMCDVREGVKGSVTSHITFAGSHNEQPNSRRQLTYVAEQVGLGTFPNTVLNFTRFSTFVQ